MGDLIHLIYTSAAREAEVPVSELEDILAISARNNARDGVTGMLLYAAGSFMQVLEGPERVVDGVFARVLRDPRHTGIVVIERGPIEERAFGQWSMGFRRLGRREMADHPAFAPWFEQGFAPARIQARPGLAMEILQEFAANQRG